MTSMIVCIVSFFAFMAYMKIKFQWYYLVAVIFAALFIAILCARDWKYVFSIWKGLCILILDMYGNVVV